MSGKGKKVKHGELDKKITKAAVDDGQHMFGRLIEIKGNVSSLAVSEELAGTLAQAMTESPADDAARDSETPSGYTFFAQFIDHDLTLDDSSILGTAVDPATVDDIRTPLFDLDCVYGLGPAGLTGHLRRQHRPAADRPPRRRG